jgi:hypothetical protein
MTSLLLLLTDLCLLGLWYSSYDWSACGSTAALCPLLLRGGGLRKKKPRGAELHTPYLASWFCGRSETAEKKR